VRVHLADRPLTLGESAAGLGALVAAIRGWLARGHEVRRTVRIELGGDVLELSDATLDDQEQFVGLFVSRHGTAQG
jgi:hypothetical protein